MTSDLNTPRPWRPRLPAVLREEPQYRLLFAGQFLSILGDRVMMVALPFAVLAVGGQLRDVAIVSAPSSCPSPSWPFPPVSGLTD